MSNRSILNSSDISASDISASDISASDISASDIKIDIEGVKFNILIDKYLDNMKTPLQIITTNEKNRKEELQNLLYKFDNEFMKSGLNTLKFNHDNITNRSIVPIVPNSIVSFAPNSFAPKSNASNYFAPKSNASNSNASNYFASKSNASNSIEPNSIEPVPIKLKPKTKINICVDIKSISDLINLTNDYKLSDDIEYNIDIKSIHNIKKPLETLNSMVGMDSLKENILDQIIYFIQGLHNHYDGDYMHTVIYGSPGTGKTEIAKIMGQIFSGINVLKKGTFKKATRSDLIAGYLGQTALKTSNLIESCLGGVLFIDEAYALGNKEGKDSFAKEAIDTLCEALSNHKNDLMVIIAGYDEELKSCFFNYNKGLESRFIWRFKTTDYSAEELKQIFIKKVNDSNWSFKNKELIPAGWFQDNYKDFKYFGRDIESLLTKIKIAHSRRVFCLPQEEKTKLTLSDMNAGLKVFLEISDFNNNNNNDDLRSIQNMYV
jgi:hypothetical protein